MASRIAAAPRLLKAAAAVRQCGTMLRIVRRDARRAAARKRRHADERARRTRRNTTRVRPQGAPCGVRMRHVTPHDAERRATLEGRRTVGRRLQILRDRIAALPRLLKAAAAVLALLASTWSRESSLADEPARSTSSSNTVAAVPAESRSSVGVAAVIKQVVIPGPEVEPKPLGDRKAPVVVRVLATFKHGSDHRYDVEYYGLDPGRYDLRDFLQRKDRAPFEWDRDAPSPLRVEIVSRLPPGQVTPSAPSATSLPSVGGNRRWMTALTLLWAAALLWVLMGKRQARAKAAATETPLTLAERLRPLIIDAVGGSLSLERQAELERLLLGYWRRRLGLDEADPGAAIATLRAHPEAGALLRQVEVWLHRPGGGGDVDVATVLAPFQDLPDETNYATAPQPPHSLLPHSLPAQGV